MKKLLAELMKTDLNPKQLDIVIELTNKLEGIIVDFELLEYCLEKSKS